MRGVQSALWLGIAALLAATFFVTGAGGSESPWLPTLAEFYGSSAGHPLFLFGATITLLLGLSFLCRPGPDDPRPFPASEFTQLCLACFAAFFLLLTILGVAHGWSPRSLAVLFLSGALNVLLAFVVGFFVAFKSEKLRLLFAGAGSLTVVTLIVATLIIIFM